LCSSVWVVPERTRNSWFSCLGWLGRNRFDSNTSHRTGSSDRLRSRRRLRLRSRNRSRSRFGLGLLFFDYLLHLFFFLRCFSVKAGGTGAFPRTGGFGSLSLKLLLFFVFHF
jgi:hypothetical protein